MPSKYDLVAVIGPTASGKTAFAARLAYNIGGEIISADSRQVYRRMNLGTGKDYDDYTVDGIHVPYHLVDIADPGHKYSIYEYQRDFLSVYKEITDRNRIPVLCGGSGMYIQAATSRYRLEEVDRNDDLRNELAQKDLSQLKEILASMKTLHNTTDVDTIERALRAIEIASHYRLHPATMLPELQVLYIGIQFSRENERKRITERLENRLKQGMVEEVNQLLQSGIPPETLNYYGLEYRYITRYLLGELQYHEMNSLLNTAIHQFSKRQRTWFRKMEKEGCILHWMDGEMPVNERIEMAVKLYGK